MSTFVFRMLHTVVVLVPAVGFLYVVGFALLLAPLLIPFVGLGVVVFPLDLSGSVFFVATGLAAGLVSASFFSLSLLLTHFKLAMISAVITRNQILIIEIW